MPTKVTLEAEPLLDPRGAFRRKAVQVTARPASLMGKTMLLFDNTQLTTQLPVYGPMFRWLSNYLEKEHHAKCSHQTRNLLKESREALTALAEEIARSDVDGVVIALCNAGITQPTVLFASELEQRGKPCVQVCTGMGYPLAGITASSYVPGLPIVLAKPATGDKDHFGEAETLAIAPEIVSGLTSTPNALLARFQERFSSLSMGAAKDGRIELASVSADVEPNARVRVDPSRFAMDLYETLCAAELSDGLPVIPPTEERVNAMLRFTDLDPDFALLAELPPSGATMTVRSVAVNAVMAGCRPEYFPIVVAAFQAIADPVYRAYQGAITTHASGNAIVVSGPLADELGIQSGAGCLGPGFRANATIGRAVNLAMMNVARAIPAKSDLGVFGTPAEYSYCFAESDKNSPWPSIHAELYGPETTSVTAIKCEGPHNCLDPRAGPEALLKVIAATGATLGGNNQIHPGPLLVILNPVQGRMFGKAGWTKRAVKEFIFETARHPVELINRSDRGTFPPEFRKMDRVPVTRSPDDIFVVVCGGGEGHAMVGVPWGLSQAATRPVTLKDGSPLETLKGRFN